MSLSHVDTFLMNKPRVTLRDISLAVGKSHVTVSLALRDHPKISSKTRARIREVAEAMGYRPDPMLRALAEHRKAKGKHSFQAALGWINHLPERDFSKHYESFRLYRLGAEKRAEELGFTLDTFHVTADKISGKSLARILHSRGISGILVSPHFKSTIDWDFDPQGLSAIAFGFSIRSPRFQIVTNSQAYSASLCVEKLKDLGHGRIGLLASRNVHERSAHNFVAGFLGAVFLSAPLDPFPVFFYEDSLANSSWREWFDVFKPDALIVDNAVEAKIIQESGICIPEELSVVLLNVFSGDDGWAGIDQRCERAGEIGVDTLVNLISHNVTGINECRQHVFVESSWKSGQTVKLRDPGSMSDLANQKVHQPTRV
jgi:DNA-binding LacI/PurR family transcriptional regulator